MLSPTVPVPEWFRPSLHISKDKQSLDAKQLSGLNYSVTSTYDFVLDDTDGGTPHLLES